VVRVAAVVVVVLSAVVLVGCGGEDDDTAAPVPVGQRFLTAADAPGSKPDPVEKRQTTDDFDTFTEAIAGMTIDPDEAEIREIFTESDFVQAGSDARFFGETHSPETSNHVFSSFIELGSEDSATSALDWLETDQLKPCPMTCAVQRSTFDVDGVPGARGVHRVATAEDIERVGKSDEVPQDDYWIAFTDGSTVYTMMLHGHTGPGTVTEDQAQQIARAYYERLTGS
jgi:hypothetical protein